MTWLDVLALGALVVAVAVGTVALALLAAALADWALGGPRPWGKP